MLSRHCWLNILLHELDEKLESKGVRAVRYADDAVLFAKSRKAAERLLEWVTDFIEQKLFLKVNAEKTKILRIGDPEVQFLGFSFTSQVSKKRRERYPTYRYFPVVHRKKMLKLKEKLKQITDRRAPGGIERVKRELKLTLRGWVNYFYKAIPAKWAERTDQWLHRRVRQIYWKQWKRPAKRREEFKMRWKNAPALHEYAYSSNRYWRMSKGVQIHMALSLDILLKEGWYDLGKAMREASRRPA